MSNFKYYYRVTPQGEPIPGSNFKSSKRPNGVYFRELIPQAVYCCDPSLIKPTSTGDTRKFYVRLNEDKLPVSGSLRRVKNRLSWDNFQEVFIDSCCPIVGINIVPSTASIEIDGTQTYTVMGIYQSGKTKDLTNVSTFESDDETIATITNNIATGIDTGTANITATYENFTSSSSLEVGIVHVESVEITNEETTLDVDDTLQMTVTVLPVDATDKSVTWESSDDTIISIDSDGLATGILAGDATITVTTVDGGFTDTKTLTVPA